MFSETLSGLRLGRRRTLDPEFAEELPLPQFDQLHVIEQYRWFGDRSTQRVSGFDGITVTEYLQPSGFWAGTPYPDEFTPLNLGVTVGVLAFSGVVIAGYPPETAQVTFSNLYAGGVAVNTTGLDIGCILGTGGGAICNSRRGATGGAGAAFAATRVRRTFKPSLYYRGATDRGDAVCTLFEPSIGTVSGPYEDASMESYGNVTWTVPGGTPAPATIEAPVVSEVQWNGSMEPYLVEDRVCGLWTQPGDKKPDTWPQFSHPVTVRLDHSELTGLAWEEYEGGFRADLGAPGTDAPEWRKWLGVGTLGKGDPAFNPDLSHRTKSSGGPAWGWGTYGQLRIGGIKLEGGVNAMRVRVYGVHLAITDSFKTGSARVEEFEVVETPYVYEYWINPIAQDGQPFVQHVDLLLPVKVNENDVESGSRQHYHGRVDRIDLLPLGGNVLKLTGLVLELRAEGPCYLKVGYGAPEERGDYSSLGFSNYGSWATGFVGDNTNKSPEDEASSPNVTGGNLRYVNILTGSFTGKVLDTQKSLGQFVSQLDSLQGITATYTEAQAQLEDGHGNSIGAPTAQCLVTTVPYQQFGPEQDHQPECVWLCKRVELTNGAEYHVGTFHVVGASVEALVERNDSRGRGDQRITMRAAGYPESARACDENGYVSVYPVPPRGPSLSLEQVFT